MLVRLLPVVLAMVLLGCGEAGTESAKGPRPETAQVTVVLSATKPAEPCPGSEQRALPASGSVVRLGVFERTRTTGDELPDLTGTDAYSWLPATTVLADESRRVGSGRLAAEVHLVPTLGVRTDGRCAADPSDSEGPGVCLTAGTGRSVGVRCFTDRDIERGRALALTGGRPAAEAHGIVPDGVDRVRVTWAAGSGVATVVENVYEVRLPGAGVGTSVSLAFDAPGQPQPCAPSPALLHAVPALRAEPSPSPPPEQLAGVVHTDPGLAEHWARIWGKGDGLTYWVVPQLHCGIVTENDRACVAVAAEFVEGAACATATDISERGASDWYPVGDRPVIAGFAPVGATSARVTVPGQEAQIFPVTAGVFAGALPKSTRMDHPDAYLLSFGT